MIACQYGYTLDQFMALTIHEVNWMLERISARRSNEKADDWEFQASLSGHKIKLPRVKIKEKPEKKKEKENPILDKKAMSVLDSALARKQEERAKRGQ